MTTRPTTLPRLFGVATVAVLVVVGAGCTSGSNDAADTQSQSGSMSDAKVNEITPLPELTAAQQAREMVAQTESEIGGRLSLLTDLADSCADCSLTLDTALSSSSNRLEVAGGLWDPWNGFEQRPWSTNQVQPISPIPQPGFTVQNVAGYMGATAKTQLVILAEAEGVPASQRVTFSALLVERLISADRLAGQFGFQLGDAIAALPADGTPSFVVDGAASPTVSAEEPQSEGQLSFEQQALVQLDCVYTELIGNVSAGDDEAQIENAVRFSQQIQDRTVSLSSLGTADHRGLRCSLSSNDPSALLSELVRIDTGLLGSDSPEIRRLAAQWALDDVDLLVARYPEQAQSLTLLNPATEVDGE
ncbi:MAG: hypothetical protein WAS54_00060 [Scrofimicrobium sp.]